MLKFVLLVGVLLCVLYSCQQEKSEKSPGNESINTERVDTIFYPDGKIEQLLRKNKITNSLNGPSESYYQSGKLSTLKYFYNDTAKGNSFEYYSNGIIKRFAYLTDFKHSPYIKDYDSTGKLIHEMGNPFVDYDVIENTTHDTLRIKVILSDYQCEKLKFEISPNGETYTNIKLGKGEIRGSQIAKMWKPILGLKHISFYMKITCIDSSFKEKVYLDTLSFKK